VSIVPITGETVAREAAEAGLLVIGNLVGGERNKTGIPALHDPGTHASEEYRDGLVLGCWICRKTQ